MANKILLIDENKADREAIIKKFATYNCEFFEEGEVVDAPATAKKIKPHLIILDLMMQKVDGLEILERLSTDEHLKNIPIMILTSQVSKETVARAARLGIRDYILKPIETAPLIERIGRIIKLGRKAKSAEDTIRIIVLEDKPRIIDQLKTMVTGSQWTIEAVSHYTDALNYVTEHEVDIVLINLCLPDDEGFQFLHALRSNERTKDLPIFGMCVKTAVEEQSRAQHDGITSFISKPLEMVDVKNKLSRALNFDVSQQYFTIKDDVLFVTFPANVNAVITELSTSIKPQMSTLVDSGLSRLLLNLTEVGARMDTDVIRLLIQITEQCVELGIRYCIVGSAQTAAKAKVFEETKSLEIFEDIDQALKSFEAQPTEELA